MLKRMRNQIDILNQYIDKCLNNIFRCKVPESAWWT